MSKIEEKQSVSDSLKNIEKEINSLIEKVYNYATTVNQVMNENYELDKKVTNLEEQLRQHLATGNLMHNKT